MTRSEIGRGLSFGLFLGLVGALVIRWIWILRGQSTPWLLMAICVVLGIVLWMVFRIAQDKVLSKDYKKMVEARRRRMH
jgi:hypothetical protein